MFCLLWTVLHTHRLNSPTFRGHCWGHSSREVVRPLKGLPEAIIHLPTFVISSLYWCHHRPLIFSSPRAWDGQLALLFHLSIAKKSLVFFSPLSYFSTEAPLLNRTYIPWAKKYHGIECAKLSELEYYQSCAFSLLEALHRVSKCSWLLDCVVCACGHGAVYVFLLGLDSF